MSVSEYLCSSNKKPRTDPLGGGVRFFSADSHFHPESGFDLMLCLERKRTERFRRSFILLLLNVEDLMPVSGESSFVRKLETALSSCVRETDIKGWYEHAKVAGIILTELNSIDETVKEKIILKIQDQLVKALGSGMVQKIRLSFHVFPESSNGNGKGREWFNTPLRPEVIKKIPVIKIPRFITRGLDIAATLSRMVMLCPFFLTNVMGVKLTPKKAGDRQAGPPGLTGKRRHHSEAPLLCLNNDESSHK
jgi:hypothetical protein